MESLKVEMPNPPRPTQVQSMYSSASIQPISQMRAPQFQTIHVSHPPQIPRSTLTYPRAAHKTLQPMPAHNHKSVSIINQCSLTYLTDINPDLPQINTFTKSTCHHISCRRHFLAHSKPLTININPLQIWHQLFILRSYPQPLIQHLQSQ